MNWFLLNILWSFHAEEVVCQDGAEADNIAYQQTQCEHTKTNSENIEKFHNRAVE